MPTEVNCPGCKATIAATPVTVLDNDSADLQPLFDGTLNRLHCADCDRDFVLDVPLIFRDTEKRQLIYCLPRDADAPLTEALGEMDTLFTQVFGELPAGELPVCRLTISRPQFIEKIAILQQGLDDRVLELAKRQLYDHSPGLTLESHDLLFDFRESDEESVNFIAFSRDSGEAAYTLSLRREDYDDMARHFLEIPGQESELNACFDGFYVNARPAAR
jgi:hypothetical protein